jgi:hypothetical protein
LKAAINPRIGSGLRVSRFSNSVYFSPINLVSLDAFESEGDVTLFNYSANENLIFIFLELDSFFSVKYLYCIYIQYKYFTLWKKKLISHTQNFIV